MASAVLDSTPVTVPAVIGVFLLMSLLYFNPSCNAMRIVFISYGGQVSWRYANSENAT